MEEVEEAGLRKEKMDCDARGSRSMEGLPEMS